MRFFVILYEMKNLLALLADWANGIFAVLLACMLTGVDPLWWHFIIGMVLAMSPDIDAVPELLSRGRVAASAEHTRDHRTFLHFPIISLPLGLLAWYLFGYWGLLWLIALVLHLINDLYGTGWGLMLLYPFSRKRFKIEPHHIFGSRESTEQVFNAYTPAELEVRIKEEGNDNWVTDTYCTVNWISITEYSLFAIAVILMLITLL